MHLKKTKRGERVYLSVVQNYREGGKTKTKTIESIGYVDQFTSQYADPIAHFQAYVAELNERARSENPPIASHFRATRPSMTPHIAQARWGSAIALAYLDALAFGASSKIARDMSAFPRMRAAFSRCSHPNA